MITVKRLKEDRWKEYRDLRLEAMKRELIAFGSSYEEEKDISGDEWKRRIKNTLFALSNDKPIGMIAFIQNTKLKTRHIVNIFGIYVKEEYRGQGIGKKLSEAALSQIQENKDVVKIELTVNPQQEAAVKLYQDCGFKIVGQLKKELYVEGRFYDELIMEKLL